MNFLILIPLVVTLTWNTQFGKGFGHELGNEKIEFTIEARDGSFDRTRRGIGDYIKKLWPWHKTVENTAQGGKGLEEKSNKGFLGYFSTSDGGHKPEINKPENKFNNDFLGWLPGEHKLGADKLQKVAFARGSGKISGTGIVVGEAQAGSPGGATGYGRGFAGDGDFTGYGSGLVIVNQKNE